MNKVCAVTLTAFLFTSCFIYEPVLPTENRSPAPDLVSEIFLMYGLAETLSIINPRYAGESFAPSLLAEHEYNANGLDYTLERNVLYSGKFGNGILSTGQAPNDIIAFDGMIALLSSGSNTVFIRNESTLELIREIYLGGGTNPYSMAYSDTTKRLYITGFLTSELLVVNPLTGVVEIRRNLRTDTGLNITGPEGIAVTNDRIFIACTNWDSSLFGYRPGLLVVYDLVNATFQSVIELETAETLNLYNTVAGFKWGLNPQSVIPFSDRGEIHVICSGSLGTDTPGDPDWEDYMSSNDGEVIIIDSTSLAIKQRLEVGGSPTWSRGGYHPLYNTVYLGGIGAIRGYRLSASGGTVLTASGETEGLYSELSGTGYFSSVVADTVNDKLFAACFNDDRVAVIDIPSSPTTHYALLDYILTLDGPLLLYLHREADI